MTTVFWIPNKLLRAQPVYSDSCMNDSELSLPSGSKQHGQCSPNPNPLYSELLCQSMCANSMVNPHSQARMAFKEILNPFWYSHCRSLVSMSSSRVSKSTTKMTQATRKQLKPALSKHTCQSAALLPQHGFSQLDLQIKYSDREKEKRTFLSHKTTNTRQLESTFTHIC